ncbi:ADP-ribosylglycohydrolase family protein [candidate division KSB1 bacterium]|nr:ADP-ribosylglycohydrolase family protein [candidate division KSB1 bacterium]
MTRIFILFVLCVAFLIINCQMEPCQVKTITIEEYIDKMKAGWVGQMVGVGWGGPTEFKWKGEIIPEDAVPRWKPDMVNQFEQDDIYVEMTFLRTLEEHGFDVSIHQAGIDFANSKYMLWHANKAGRNNLRSGIAPPYSGHPKYNTHADDIDYQIEADYSGLIAPGMPNTVIELGDKFGRIMNYGDGLYGGLFVGGMYAAAFFEKDIEKIIDAGLACIPEKSMYYECIANVVDWYRKYPDNWEQSWHLIQNKYQDYEKYRKFSCGGPDSDFNIDAKINGAYIVMGLLYGNGDIDSTIAFSMRCGQDSDCNPSNAAGILFTKMGFSNIPEKYKKALDSTQKFSYTEYNFEELIDVCEKLAHDAVLRSGGKIQKDEHDEEVFVIPIKEPVPGELEQCWEPEEIKEDVYFSEEEMQQITIRTRKPDEFISKWQVSGPYTKEGANSAKALFDVIFPPEPGNDQNADWQTLPADRSMPHIVQFHNIFGGKNRVAYMRTRFHSDDARNAVLELGTDDGTKVWLNGELVHSLNVARGLMLGADRIDVRIQKGWNTLLIKVTQEAGGWEAAACLCDEKKNALGDLDFQI